MNPESKLTQNPTPAETDPATWPVAEALRLLQQDPVGFVQTIV